MATSTLRIGPRGQTSHEDIDLAPPQPDLMQQARQAAMDSPDAVDPSVVQRAFDDDDVSQIQQIADQLEQPRPMAAKNGVIVQQVPANNARKSELLREAIKRRNQANQVYIFRDINNPSLGYGRDRLGRVMPIKTSEQFLNEGDLFGAQAAYGRETESAIAHNTTTADRAMTGEFVPVHIANMDGTARQLHESATVEQIAAMNMLQDNGMGTSSYYGQGEMPPDADGQNTQLRDPNAHLQLSDDDLPAKHEPDETDLKYQMEDLQDAHESAIADLEAFEDESAQKVGAGGKKDPSFTITRDKMKRRVAETQAAMKAAERRMEKAEANKVAQEKSAASLANIDADNARADEGLGLQRDAATQRMTSAELKIKEDQEKAEKVEREKVETKEATAAKDRWTRERDILKREYDEAGDRYKAAQAAQTAAVKAKNKDAKRRADEAALSALSTFNDKRDKLAEHERTGPEKPTPAPVRPEGARGQTRGPASAVSKITGGKSAADMTPEERAALRRQLGG